MTQYKVGDKVRVIKLEQDDSSYGIKVGQEYKVHEIWNERDADARILAPNGKSVRMYDHQLEPVVEPIPYSFNGETLTIGQVVDKLQYGEVAVLVNKATIGGRTISKIAVYFNEKTGMLTSTTGRPCCPTKVDSDSDCGRYVIVSRELYNTIKNI